jgi:hypothetical protein
MRAVWLLPFFMPWFGHSLLGGVQEQRTSPLSELPSTSGTCTASAATKLHAQHSGEVRIVRFTGDHPFRLVIVGIGDQKRILSFRSLVNWFAPSGSESVDISFASDGHLLTAGAVVSTDTPRSREERPLSAKEIAGARQLAEQVLVRCNR